MNHRRGSGPVGFRVLPNERPEPDQDVRTLRHSVVGPGGEVEMFHRPLAGAVFLSNVKFGGYGKRIGLGKSKPAGKNDLMRCYRDRYFSSVGILRAQSRAWHKVSHTCLTRNSLNVQSVCRCSEAVVMVSPLWRRVSPCAGQ